MALMLIILKEETQIRKVVSTLLELEIVDATVLDGEGVENLAVRTIPLFAEIGSLFNQDLAYNRTILAYIPSPDLADEVIRLCRREGLDLADPAVACVLTLPCARHAAPPAELSGERGAEPAPSKAGT
jgi:hypothetical protein